MVQTYMNMFGKEQKMNNFVIDLLEQGYNKEIDTSDLLDNENAHKYQSLIGSLQWAIYLGIFDICSHVMTISIFKYAPCQVHLDQVKRIYNTSSIVIYPTTRLLCFWFL